MCTGTITLYLKFKKHPEPALHEFGSCSGKKVGAKGLLPCYLCNFQYIPGLGICPGSRNCRVVLTAAGFLRCYTYAPPEYKAILKRDCIKNSTD
jgi:hypothetical protein